MRPSVRPFAFLAAFAVLAFGSSAGIQAQSTASPTAGNGTYVVVDPLAGVRYDNRYDASVDFAYRHMKAGPNLLQGANLGGLDASGSYWFSKHWAVEGTGRGYLGTSGAAPNTIGGTGGIRGPFIQEYIVAAGAEWLGPHNKHGDLMAHALFGGAAGIFEGDLHGASPVLVGFYNNQIAPAAIIGGHIDLNRSAHWVFRITPDSVWTRYNQNGTVTTNGASFTTNRTQTDVNFAISVGLEYKFRKKR